MQNNTMAYTWLRKRSHNYGELKKETSYSGRRTKTGTSNMKAIIFLVLPLGETMRILIFFHVHMS